MTTNSFLRRSLHTAASALPAMLPVLVVAGSALAGSSGDADWLAPATEGVTSLTSTLTTLGGGVIGLAIVAFGLWAAMSGRVEWTRLWVFFVAGLLVTVGPAGIIWLIDKFQSGGK